MDAEQIAKEVTEGTRAIMEFATLPNVDKVSVIKHVLDAEIGSDPGAHIPSIPGLTPEMTELITDPLLDLAAKAIVGKFFSAEAV